MYKINKARKTVLSRNTSTVAETIEEQVERLRNNNEKIGDDGKELIYTEKGKGVIAAYNIRTDKFELALDALDKFEANKLARTQAEMKIVKDDEENGKTEPTADTKTKE